MLGQTNEQVAVVYQTMIYYQFKKQLKYGYVPHNIYMLHYFVLRLVRLNQITSPGKSA